MMIDERSTRNRLCVEQFKCAAKSITTMEQIVEGEDGLLFEKLGRILLNVAFLLDVPVKNNSFHLYIPRPIVHLESGDKGSTSI